MIDIQRKSDTQDDAGEPISVWTNIASRRAASMLPVRGDERFSAPEIVANEQVEFRIRWSQNVADLSPLDRIVYPAMSEGDTDIPARRIFDIMAVHEIGRREGLQIIAYHRPDVAAS